MPERSRGSSDEQIFMFPASALIPGRADINRPPSVATRLEGAVGVA